MRFKMRTSRSFVVLVMLMMTSQICHPSLANESRDLIDDHAPDEVRNRIFPPFPYQPRFGAARAGSARPGPPQLLLNSWTRLSGVRPLQAGSSGDPQPFEDLTEVDTPPSYHSQIGHQAPPPAYNPPPSYDQLFPQRSPRAPSPSQSRQSAVNRGPTTLSIESMEARTVFTVILPQIQRERPTLQEMRLKGQVRKADANNYEFVFKASDIVRQGGRRKIVRCSVLATRQGRGLGDFRVSGLTCELSRKNLLRWGRSERYYPVRNRKFEEKFPSNGYEKIRNRIFPPFPVQRQNWVGVVNVPVNRRRQGARPPPPPPPQGLPAHLANLPIEDRHPPPLYSGIEREGPPPPYANLGQPEQPLSAADILQPPPAYDQIYPNGPRRAAAAGPARRISGLGQFGTDQRPERNPRPERNQRPNPGPFNAQSRDARRIFELITPKIQRERLTLSDMRLKDATKIEGTPSYEFVFKATDIVRPGGRRKTVRCSVRANLTPMIRDFTISALTCERTRRNLQGWVTSNRYYPAVRGKRASFLASKIHNRVAPVNRRYRWQSGPAQSNESVVGQNPPSHQRLNPGSSQPDNPSRHSLSRPEAFNPMGQTYIQRSRQFIDARRIFNVITPKIQHERPTLQEMRLEKARMIDGTVPSYEFDFKASDIVRQGGRRKSVRCSVRADVITGRFHMISQSDLVISELTCERLSRKRWSKPKQYYPVRNFDFEEKSQLGDLEQVRNRIFPPFPNKHNANQYL